LVDHDPQRKGNRWRGIALQVALAVTVATAIDLGLAALNGYPLTRPFCTFPPPLGDTVVVVVLNTLCLCAVVVPAYLLLVVARRLPGIGSVLERVPRFSIAAAAVLPVVVNRLIRAPGTVEPLVVAALLVVPAALLLAESLGTLPRPGRREGPVSAGMAGLVVVLAFGLPSLGPSLADTTTIPSAPRAVEDGPNLLIIVLDTVRADHLGLYGSPRPTTPWLDAFARSATVFDAAVAASSFTLPSHATLFTGLYPESHGAVVRDDGVSLSELGLEDDWTPVQPLAQEAVTLAEIVADAGLETGAIAANVAYLSPYFALDQGFATYAVAAGGWYSWQPAGFVFTRKLLGKLASPGAYWWFRSRVLGRGRYYLLAPEVNRLALRWLEPRRDQRFFLFLNYMDAHAPYLPHSDYRGLFPESDAPQILDRERTRPGDPDNLAESIGPMGDAYDAEIRYLDDHLGELFSRLDSWGVLDDTMVLIVGDHGESFGEHDEMDHATGLHEPQLRVPLLLRFPGQTEGRRVERRVHLVDVMPTLLDAMGLERPEDLQAGSLLDAERPLPVAAHLGPYGRDYSENAIYGDPWKLIVSSRGDIELYDIVADPQESTNLAEERAGVVRDMMERLGQFKSEALPRFGPAGTAIDAKTLERLRALGYVN
jgi:arylsulfatase A-like enzyme